jgi:hypothetical protein
MINICILYIMVSFIKMTLLFLLMFVIILSLILRGTKHDDPEYIQLPDNSPPSVAHSPEGEVNGTLSTSRDIIHCLKKDSDGKKKCERMNFAECEENHKESYLNENNCNRALKNWKDQIDKIYCLNEEGKCNQVRIQGANDGCPINSTAYESLDQCEDSI